jgi:type VI secretion system protein ImpJ
MYWDNKVVWSDGMFLRPHHFQQLDRYVEKLVRTRTEGLRPDGWGLGELVINRDLLGTGKVALTRASGVLADGTPFMLPDDADHPMPLEPAETTRDALVYLALPALHPGRPEFPGPAANGRPARYGLAEFEAANAVIGAETAATLQVARLRLRLMLQDEDRSGFTCLGVLRIAEVRPDRRIILDDAYIPPVQACAASPQLAGFIDEIVGLLNQRAAALAPRLAQSGSGAAAAEIADFLLLQLCNRYQPVLAHHATNPRLHPETLYSGFLQLAGELATFTAALRRPPVFEPYRHDDLQRCFTPLMLELRGALSAVQERTAVPIPLRERPYGIRVGMVPDPSLWDQANFVLAVKADIAAEQLRRNFPAQVKIGSVESIRDLVMSALPGIGLEPLQMAPRQIPFTAGTLYFRLDQGGQHWRRLSGSGGIALHLAGNYPGLAMELWAIRG